MTKQEQIEEMTEKMQRCFEKNGVLNFKWFAEALYNACYRKIKDETLEERNGIKAEIKHLNTIVERLDELLGKGINDYIMGIDGVEGLKDMWERSAVREFAEKIKAKSYVNNYCREVVEIDKIDELLKEYE